VHALPVGDLRGVLHAAGRHQPLPRLLVSVGLLLAGVWVLLFGLLLLAQGGAAP